MTKEWTAAPVDFPLPGNGGAIALRAERQKQGVSLRELGQRVGVSAATLSQIETGKTTLTANRAVSLAAALNIDPASMHPVLDGRSAPRRMTPSDPLHWRIFPPIELDVALNAALHCFSKTGYHGTSVRDIARDAGLSVPGLYHYQPSKQAMLSALFDLGMSDLLARSRAARDEGRDTRERFALLVEALALFNAHRPELSFLGASEIRALHGADRRRHAEIRNEQQHMIGGEVERGVREGVFATQAPHAAARAVATMCAGIPHWYRTGGPFTPEQIAAQYVDFSLGAVWAER